MDIPTLNASAKKLLDAIRGGVDTVPPNWVTLSQAVAHWEVSETCASGLLRGKEKRKFRIKVGNNVRAVLHYRLK